MAAVSEQVELDQIRFYKENIENSTAQNIEEGKVVFHSPLTLIAPQ